MRSYRTFRCIRFYLGALIAAKCHVIGTRLAATKSNAPMLAFRPTHPVTVVVKFAVSIERTGDSTVPQGQIIFVGDCMGASDLRARALENCGQVVRSLNSNALFAGGTRTKPSDNKSFRSKSQCQRRRGKLHLSRNQIFSCSKIKCI
jgi:hypothetical protein